MQIEQEGKKDADEKKDKILDEAQERYRMCVDAMSRNLEMAESDLNFLAGGNAQWDDAAVNSRTAAGLPVITVNTLPAYLHQVTNDQRMNTPAIKVHPVDDNADMETAKIYQGLIRHIEYDSNADVAQDTAVNNSAAIGFGYFGLITDYASEDSFDQDIKFRRIRNPLSVKVDPLSVEADGSDMQYCFIETLMSKEEFKRQYPDADAGDTATFMDGINAAITWIDENTVLVCEYYAIEKVEDTLLLLVTGERVFKSDFKGSKEEIQDSRPTTRSKVMWRKITACDVLEETEIKCRWIPVFPVYGDEIDIKGKVVRSGIIRNAKGPAQMYNVFMSVATGDVMLRGRNPWVMAEGQEEGHEDEWTMANRATLPYVLYKPVTIDGTLAPPPQRNAMPEVPTGMLALAMQAKENIMATTGLFQASIGQKGTATSGKQELAQQREGDVANFHYMDGLLRSLRHCGRCLVNMIPYYYDTKRTIRILGEDESAQHVTINDKDETGEALNDLTAGTYDVTISSGPSFTTARQEGAEFFTQALSGAKDPASAAIFGYWAMRNQDTPYSETAAKMMATTLPPPAKAVLDEETAQEGEEGEVIQTPKGPLPVAQVPQVLQQLEMQIQQMGEQLEQADVAKQQAMAMKAQTDQEKVALERERAEAETMADGERIKIEQTNAETARMKAETERFKAQSEADKSEAELLITHQQMQTDAQLAELTAINGDTTAFEAWKATLESETRIRVAEIAARSADSRARLTAHVAMNKPQPPKGESKEPA